MIRKLLVTGAINAVAYLGALLVSSQLALVLIILPGSSSFGSAFNDLILQFPGPHLMAVLYTLIFSAAPAAILIGTGVWFNRSDRSYHLVAAALTTLISLVIAFGPSLSRWEAALIPACLIGGLAGGWAFLSFRRWLEPRFGRTGIQ